MSKEACRIRLFVFNGLNHGPGCLPWKQVDIFAAGFLTPQRPGYFEDQNTSSRQVQGPFHAKTHSEEEPPVHTCARSHTLYKRILQEVSTVNMATNYGIIYISPILFPRRFLLLIPDFFIGLFMEKSPSSPLVHPKAAMKLCHVLFLAKRVDSNLNKAGWIKGSVKSRPGCMPRPRGGGWCFLVFFCLTKDLTTWHDHLRYRYLCTYIWWVFPKIVVPRIIHFNRVFHYKPSILGYPYFWKRP